MAKCTPPANIKIKPKKEKMYWLCPQCEKEGVEIVVGYCRGETEKVWYKACHVCGSLIDWSEEK